MVHSSRKRVEGFILGTDESQRKLLLWQEMSCGNEVSTHSRGAKTAAPPQLGLRLKSISRLVNA